MRKNNRGLKIVILCDDIGVSAAGIVYKRIIEGLAINNEITVITSNSVQKFRNKIVRYKSVLINTKRIHNRINEVIYSLLGINFNENFWTTSGYNALKKLETNKINLVFAFASNNSFGPLILGKKYAKKNAIPYLVYLVDAIPAPIGWSENNLYYRRRKFKIRELLESVDGLFSANAKMLNYQMTLLKAENRLVSSVILNPSSGRLKKYKYTGNGVNTFLYTGSIYGPRKFDFILGAFKALLLEYPNSMLELVGTTLPKECSSILDEFEFGKIKIHPFVRDLSGFYSRATALLDVDSFLENDVYLSSKITNYICVDRIIISQTGANSPSRELFKDTHSIFQCLPKTEEILIAMKKAILYRDAMDFKDRSGIIELFSVKEVVRKLNSEFKNFV